MRYKDQRRATVHDLADALKTFLREEHVAHAERFVDDEDVGLHAHRHGEGEAHHHAGGVRFDGLLDEVTDVGEGGDLVETLRHLGVREAVNGAVKKDVFAAGELGVEAGAELEEGGDAAVDLDGTRGRRERAGDELEQGGFAGAVAADDARGLAAADFEGDVAQGVEIAVAASGAVGEAAVSAGATREEHGGGLRKRAMEAGGRALPNAVSFGEIFNRDDDVAGHGAEQETGGNRRPEARARMELARGAANVRLYSMGPALGAMLMISPLNGVSLSSAPSKAPEPDFSMGRRTRR